MKLLLLGATGRTGRWVLEKALEKGYEVRCLARNVHRISPRDRLTVIEGDPSQATDLQKAFEGCQYVISVLNISRQSDFPWAPLRTPEDYLSRVMNTLLPIAKAHSIQRVVVCSAWGVGETGEDIPWWFKWTIDHSNIGVAYKDHALQEEVLTLSDIPWTIVRPPGLTNFKKKEQIKVCEAKGEKPQLLISRQSVAAFMVESLQREDLVGKKVVISKV
ncbi:MAG: NAD(P)H-binding protein [Bacteroidota bacterium]